MSLHAVPPAGQQAVRLAGPSSPADQEIAVLIPCYNEELTIAAVVAGFRAELPSATIYVFDNNSTDDTAQVARQAGAVVVRERRQGKGFVVQSMFRKVEADLYVMVDGDGTYPARDVRRLLEPILRDEADMVVGSRLDAGSRSAFRRWNLLGNRGFLLALNGMFRVRLTDILSGYRAFSRAFVKTIALVGGGFEVETELTIKTIEAGFRIAEVPICLGQRPRGSESKIRHVRDGLRILGTIFTLFRDYKPLTFFGSVALALWGAGLLPGTIVLTEFLRTGAVPQIPAAILALALMLSGMLSVTVGIVLHSMTRRIRELEYLIRCMAARDTAEAPLQERRRAG